MLLTNPLLQALRMEWGLPDSLEFLIKFVSVLASYSTPRQVFKGNMHKLVLKSWRKEFKDRHIILWFEHLSAPSLFGNGGFTGAAT